MGSDTKWADVAHYYTKSQIDLQIKNRDHAERFLMVSFRNVGGSHFEEWVNDGVYWRAYGSQFSAWEDHKPILTHFEDITGDQAREFYTLKTGLPSKYVNRIIIRGKSADIVSITYLKKFPAAKVIFVDIANKATPLGGQHATKEFLWLISRGFDVFGLIESGQAIRKEVTNVE